MQDMPLIKINIFDAPYLLRRNSLACLLIFLLALTFYLSVVSDLHIQLFTCA